MYEKLKLLVCALGIFVTYSVYGYLQEDITKTKYGPDGEIFAYTTAMVFVQCIINAIFAITALKMTGETADDTPITLFASCGFTYIFAMFSSNYSLRYVTYPTQVLGKSCKPIGVMLTSLIFFRRRYPTQKFILVSFIVLGVVLFVWKDKKATKGLDTDHTFGWGEGLLLASLICDGLTGNQQETMRIKYATRKFKMMFHLNIWSTLYLGLFMLGTGEAMRFATFAFKYPEVLQKIGVFSLCSAIGQLFIFTTVTNFGPLQCSIITTTRKFFNILLSIFMFGHAMSNRQWLATGIVFTALILDNVMKVKKPEAKSNKNGVEQNGTAAKGVKSR